MQSPAKKKIQFPRSFSSFIIHPLVLALPFTFLIFFLLPLEFEKFKVELIKEEFQPNHDYYYDMDFDGDTEWISYRYDDFENKTGSNIIMSDKPFSLLVIDQVNLNYTFVENAKPIFADYDHNSLAEVYIFLKNDTALFIAGIEYNDTSQHLENPSETFINHIHYDKNGIEDFRIFNAPSVDLNDDGYDEIIFTIQGRYCAKPREICAYDVYNDSIFRTPPSAIAYVTEPVLLQHTFENDNWIITTNTYVYNNYKMPGNLYDDSCGWALAFDKNMDFWFEPIPNSIGYWNIVQSLPFAKKDKAGIISVFNKPKGSDKQEALRTYNLNGKLIREHLLEKGKQHTLFPHDEKPGELFYLAQDEPPSITIINTEFAPLETTTLEFSLPTLFSRRHFNRLDLNNDHKREIILSHLTNEVIICTPDFTNPVHISLPYNKVREVQKIQLDTDKKPILFIKNGDQHLYYHYLKNNFYYWKYPIIAGIYFLSTIFFYYLLRFQKKMLNRQHKAEKLLYHHQMLSIKNQVDPHFTLNAINNISAMYISGQNEEANRFLTKFSRLIHRSLMDSDKIETTIEEEIRFVTDYLDVQKIRFKDTFDYTVTFSSENLKTIKIPRQLIHTFVENAIKHGLRPKETNGLLIISISEQEGKIEIIIDDNGVGRNAVTTAKSTGKGISIVKQIITLYEKLQGKKVSYKVVDKKDESGKTLGTRVDISIPKDPIKGKRTFYP